MLCNRLINEILFAAKETDNIEVDSFYHKEEKVTYRLLRSRSRNSFIMGPEPNYDAKFKYPKRGNDPKKIFIYPRKNFKGEKVWLDEVIFEWNLMKRNEEPKDKIIPMELFNRYYNFIIKPDLYSDVWYTDPDISKSRIKILYYRYADSIVIIGPNSLQLEEIKIFEGDRLASILNDVVYYHMKAKEAYPEHLFQKGIHI